MEKGRLLGGGDGRLGERNEDLELLADHHAFSRYVLEELHVIKVLPPSPSRLLEAIREPPDDSSDRVIVQRVAGGVGHDLEEDGEPRLSRDVAPLVTVLAGDDELDDLAGREAEDDSIFLLDLVPSQQRPAEREDVHASPFADLDHAAMRACEVDEVGPEEAEHSDHCKACDGEEGRPDLHRLGKEEEDAAPEARDEGHEHGHDGRGVLGAVANAERRSEVVSEGVSGQHDV